MGFLSKSKSSEKQESSKPKSSEKQDPSSSSSRNDPLNTDIPSEAPPPYSPPTPSGPSGPPGKPTYPISPQAQLPVPPSNQNVPRQHFHIYRDSMMNHDLTIMAPDKTNVAYTVAANPTIFSTGPHLRLWRCPAHMQSQLPPVGVVTFRHFHTLELQFCPSSAQHSPGPGPIIPLQGTVLGRSYSFPSMYFGPLTWQRRAVGTDMDLVNGSGQWIARFESRVSVDKVGVLEMANWGFGPEAMDEIVVSAVALVENNRRRR